MRVLHVLYKLMPSGAEKMLADSVEAFKSNGVDSYVLANDDEEGPFAPTLKNLGCHIYRIPWHDSRRHLVGFWKLCRKEHIDVVHIHVIRGYLGFAVAARFAGVKVVVKTFHGIFSARDNIRKFWHILIRFAARILGVKMVAISRSVQENEFNLFHNRCQLIWNFANDANFPIADMSVRREMRRRLGVSDAKWILLTVGNCHSDSHYRIKNHQLVIRAIACLPKEFRQKIVYLHVGEEMDGYPERKLAEELNVGDQVMFLGPRNDVYALLSTADAYVMSSLHEGLGISAIEAAFTGREMILTRVEGLIDFGQIIPVGIDYCDLSPESLAMAIVKKAENGVIPKGSKVIRAAALRTFSMDVGVPRLISIYGRT